MGSILLYDDYTNAIVKDLSEEDWHYLEDFCTIANMLAGIDGNKCHFIRRMMYYSTEFESKTFYHVFFYTSKGWVSLRDFEKDALILKRVDYRHPATRLQQNVFNKYREESEKAPLFYKKELDFYIRRSEIQNILIEVDPIRQIGFPLFGDILTSYAKESYDIARVIGNGVKIDEGEEVIKDILLSHYEKNIEEKRLDLVVKKIYHERNDHICPTCKEHIFEDENSTDICPVCGWKNDIKTELFHENERNEGFRDEEINNIESLSFKQMQYYLLSHAETKQEAIDICGDYLDILSSLKDSDTARYGDEESSMIFKKKITYRGSKYLDKYVEKLQTDTYDRLMNLFVNRQLSCDKKYAEIVKRIAFPYDGGYTCGRHWENISRIKPLLKKKNYLKAIDYSFENIPAISLYASYMNCEKPETLGSFVSGVINDAGIRKLGDILNYTPEELNNRLGKRIMFNFTVLLNMFGADCDIYNQYILEENFDIPNEITNVYSEEDLKKIRIIDIDWKKKEKWNECSPNLSKIGTLWDIKKLFPDWQGYRIRRDIKNYNFMEYYIYGQLEDIEVFEDENGEFIDENDPENESILETCETKNENDQEGITTIGDIEDTREIVNAGDLRYVFEINEIKSILLAAYDKGIDARGVYAKEEYYY